MKTYQLPRDIPMAKAGEIFILEDNGYLHHKTNTNIFYTANELEKYNIIED